MQTGMLNSIFKFKSLDHLVRAEEKQETEKSCFPTTKAVCYSAAFLKFKTIAGNNRVRSTNSDFYCLLHVLL